MSRSSIPAGTDIPAFIERITREIWEERGIGASLLKYYAPDVIVRAANAITIGNEGVAAATLATLHEFPDRRLVYEDVIWGGNESDGFISSHRLISVMHKQNAGAYGPAHGQLVRSRIIADCVIRNGTITEEWLVRDHGAFATCLGTTPEALGRDLAQSDLAANGKVVVFTSADDIPGTYLSVIDDSAEARRYSDAWEAIWGTKTPSAIREYYHQGASVYATNGEVLNGHDDLDRFAISWLASFPDGEITIDHLIVNRDPGQPIRLALRWSIKGTHKGWGRFGKPTGAPVYILGMTHAHMVAGMIIAEWVCIDEVAVWKQIHGHTLSKA